MIQLWHKYCQISKRFKLALIILVIIFLAENLILAYNNLQNKSAILGLKFNGQNLTGLNGSQIEEVVKKEVEKNNRPLKLAYQDKNFQIKPQEIGVKVDVGNKVDKLLEKGRKGPFWQKIIEQQQALLGVNDDKLSGNISQTLLTLKILEIQNEINQEATPLTPDFLGDPGKTIPPADGIKVHTDKLTILIANNIFHPPEPSLSIPVIKTFTTHNEEELEPIRKQVTQLVTSSISISSGGLIFTLSPLDIRSMLTLVERLDPNDPKKLKLVLRLDDVKLNQKLGEFAQKVENITHAEFDDHDARVAIYSQFYSPKRRLITIPTGKNLAKAKVLGTETQTGPKIAYLTFDDGPNSIYHPMILDILKAYDVKATFFLVGQNAQKDFDVARRTYMEGHNIGNHSNTHSFLPKLSSSAIQKELQLTSGILKQVNDNKDITLFRPPYGGVNLYVKKYADALRMKLFLWDVDPRDWSEPATDELVRRVVTATSNGSDILLHSNHLATVKALPKIIEILKSQGYNFEKLN